MSDSVNLRAQLQSIIEKLEAIPAMKDKAEPFKSVLTDLDRDCLRIGVIGITSAGKSTFLNVLLGRDLLPEQSKATTNMLVNCRKGPKLTMEVIWKNGRPTRIYEGRKVTSATVAKYCCEDLNPENKKEVESVIIRSPDMLLPEDFELVDTPGIDAYGHEEHEELTLRKFLPKADIVLYTTSIKYPIKQADARVLGQVVQNDQRVLFVQTFKDVVKDSSEKGVVIKTREQELREYLERIQDDVKKCAPALKAHLFCQISSYLAKDPRSYLESGFDELLDDIRLLGKELAVLIQERLSGRVMRHLDLCLGTISEMIYGMEGDWKAALNEKQKREARISALKDCLRALDESIQNVSELNGGSFLSAIRNVLLADSSSEASPSGIGIPATLLPWALQPWWVNLVHKSDEMGRQSDDYSFLDKWNSLLEHVQELQTTLLSQLDRFERDCQISLDSLNIAPFHHDTKTLAALPSAPQVQWESVQKTVKERRWYTLWLYEHERKITEVRLDRKRAKEDLLNYAHELCGRVNRHMAWWKDHCVHRYRSPVMEELASAEKTSSASETFSAAQPKLFKQTKKELTELRSQFDFVAKKRQERRRPGPKQERTAPSGRQPKYNSNLIRSLLHGRRETAFQRQLLACVNSVSSSQGPLTLLCLGGKRRDHQELIALLTHRLKDVDTIPLGSGLNVWCEPDGEPPRFFFNFQGEWELHVEPRRIMTRLNVISCPPEHHQDKNLRWEDLFQSVDAVGIFVNCSQISSGVNDIEKSEWVFALREFKPKVFFIGLDMSYYRAARGHELVTQVLPKLGESSLGNRPYLLADEYEVRFTQMARYGERLLQSFQNVIRAKWDEECRTTVLDWETNKISFRPPFTRAALLETFKRIYDDRHEVSS